MNDFAHSARARQARIVKADRLATFLLSAGGPWPDYDKDRRLVEKIAGVRPASEETWSLARAFYDDVLASRERSNA